MLFSNLTVFEHLPLVNSEAITFASSTSSNSSINGLKVVVITISLSPTSISTSSFEIPGIATFR